MKQPPLPSAPPLMFMAPPQPNLDPKISPSVILIIVILSAIFFLAGILHLLIRCLLTPTQRHPDAIESVSVLQGQLQQLFQLHDGGVDQSCIDTLPVFQYKAIIGVKDPFDCAVCLSEFEPEDKLRLLPQCSHAFHMDCIDTWLLSHSTCPLCRSSLIDEFSDGCAPIVCVLESGRNSGSDSDPRIRREEPEMGSKGEEEKIVSVKLGKFRNLEGNGGEGGSEINEFDENNELGSRRCFSMGSFAYILDEKTSLQVPIRTPMKKQSSGKKPSLPLKPGHRAVISEYGCDSRREFNGIEAFRTIHKIQNSNRNIGYEREKEESFSISRTWARTGERNKKGNEGCSSRRTIPRSEIGVDNDETQSCYSVDSLANNPSSSTSTRRTLLWLMGRQNKFAHHHSSSISANIEPPSNRTSPFGTWRPEPSLTYGDRNPNYVLLSQLALVFLSTVVRRCSSLGPMSMISD
ncbi:hypothetical protein Cgig2_007807 [Carnegiea gigantea]|uniref:RING-type E3 ubiquitin transferase n=1 Tax=Carnegiea gigantea TaxID=171969 RepID=A0A9Q1GWV0_9CARY|nr:hypothetical protein Cgig2_007807 [Carnegiea gigantea]